MAPFYTPSKRRLAADDPFFDQGNAEASAHYIGSRAVCVSRGLHMTDIVDLILENSTRQTITCHDPPCHGSARFPTVLAYERHYDQMHRNCCSLCNAALPSAHWLDLHIQECHDAFFRARVARSEKPYQCFLPACSRTFSRPHRRKMHMIDKHHFARSFNWRLVRTGLRSTSKLPAAVKSARRRDAARRDPVAQQPQADDDNAQNMDVDQLTSEFKRSLSVGVPRSVSFGRRGGGSNRNSNSRGAHC
ncbi:hypothetical protein H4R20_001692 [Coemansia guatemalensis]|uniref:C2H2-type domain-containing protein n=1 Tax=Coemansia guatemalensis TaxID=2761395 RepID=A0A9W8HZ13_9FUNG|nr:hypothetical protein H4R20_001692 [Coemansia guatemalensis]